MSQTLDQIFTANPAASMNLTDLLYLVRSPYTPGTDFGITFNNFQLSITAVGTLGTGVWNATTISTTYGGTGVSNPTAHGIMVAEGSSPVTPIVLTNGQLLIGSTGVDPVAATLTAGTGITITNGAGSVSIASNGATPWVDQTTASVTMTTNRGYTADAGASLITFTLPVASAIGDFLEIVYKGAGGWSIAQTAGQQIQFGVNSTTVGVGGSLSSNAVGDCIRLRCSTANLLWTVVSAVGTLTYV